MPIVSYAQNFEDVLLWRALHDVGTGFYIDIGAQDPVADSVSKAFYEKGWRGVHVEPTAHYVELLRRDRPDETVIHAAVSDRPGMLKFFEIPGTGLSTGSAIIAEGHRRRDWKVVETLVSAVTLDELFASIDSKQVHWLKIDVEGFERAVLKGWRKSAYRPWIVVVEAVEPMARSKSYKDWEPLLFKKGYSFVHFDGLNRYYLSAAHKELKKHFRYGPSLWDEFQLPEISRVTSSLVRRNKEALDQLRVETMASIAQESEAAAQARANIVNLNTALAGTQEAANQMRSALDQSQNELSQAHSSVAHTKSELERTRGELGQSRERLNAAQGELERTRGELGQSQERLNAAQGELERARGELGQSQEKLNAAQGELERTRGELGQTRDERNQAQGELSQVRRALDQTRETLDRTREELTGAQAEFNEARQAVALTRRELDHTRGVLAKARTELNRTRRESGLMRDSLDQARRDRDRTEDELEQTRIAMDRLLDDLDQSRAELNGQRVEANQHRDELARVRTELDRVVAEARRHEEVWSSRHAYLMTELAEVTGSFWWRLSLPFRKRRTLSPVLAARLDSDGKADADNTQPATSIDLIESHGAHVIARNNGVLLPPESDPQSRRIISSIEELLSLDDEAFVRSVYATVLGRDPDQEGLVHYLACIRGGESRRRILADISLAADVQERAHTLPGLDRVIRLERRLRLPLVGPILRLAGANRERVDVQRKLAVIETKLDLLARAIPSEPAAGQGEEHIPATDHLSVLETHAVASPVDVGRTCSALPEAPDARPLPADKSLPADQSLRLTWRIGLESEVTEDETQVRVELTQALVELGQQIVPESSATPADVTAIWASRSHSKHTRDGSVLLVGFDWEESGFPAQSIDEFKNGSCSVACASSHSRKILIDHGVDVPVGTVGVGVDHWESIQATPDYRAPGKHFRFLHVSSCDPGKGADLLLESFGRVFASDDDVSLIINSTGAMPRDLSRLLEQLRTSNPSFPDVVVIDGKADPSDLKALYEQCDAFVAPSRAEGFGLHIAKAFLSGLPVVATAWGGHLDYCDAANSWLVDYCFSRARTSHKLFVSVWAEPTAPSLDDALWAAFRAEPAERFAKSSAGRRRLLEDFTWRKVASRLVRFAEQATADVAGERVKSRVGWITTWNVQCGIAGHVEHLLESVPSDQFLIFAARQEEPKTKPDEANCLRSWDLGKHGNGLDEIGRELACHSIGALVIQFNYGFFNHLELNAFIEAAVAKDIPVIIDLHSTIDPLGETENFRLADFLGGLRKCHRILAHGIADLDRLKELGLVHNVMLFPHGVMNRGRESSIPAVRNIPPLIASFGFCLPNKGLLELVEAVGLLKQGGTAVRLLMLNAEFPAAASATEVQRIEQAIQEMGLQENVEMRKEFLDDEVCLALLARADLVVNPYQRTGESASGAVRYGLACGRPVAVTPLPIFDDLGDAVFRMPGTTPRQLAEGIADALAHLRNDSEFARHIQEEARRWCEEHDYAQQASRLMRTVRFPTRREMPRALRSARSTTPAIAAPIPAQLARGAFINTAKENCSIHESGRMVFHCIRESGYYTLDYFSLDMFDVPALATEGRIRPVQTSQSRNPIEATGYDFWVFNWHFITMANRLDLESIGRLPGRKFTVVLELEPSDPLKLIPLDVFDGYIALDPTTPATKKIFPFPRPLEGDPRKPGVSHDVPVIGSFGFGTPGKGFELLVESVNREFDRAVVRVNIPQGAYTASMDGIHRQEYSQYLEALCKRIAKPGIDVRFSHDFMSPEELVTWCGENDLNCFMYTRRQSGLSATTDQAIMSGRPLVTGSNDTFRHIQRYIPPYPITGLRQALDDTASAVRRMQQDWSHESFLKTFERMLSSCGLVELHDCVEHRQLEEQKERSTILVAARRSAYGEDILCYATRLADCLGRSGIYEILRVYCTDLYEVEEQVAARRPSAVILVDAFGTEPRLVAQALALATGPKIVLADDAEYSDGAEVDENGLTVLARDPIVPYYTPFVASREDPPRIMMVGFSARASNLEEILAKIAEELPAAVVFLEVPETGQLDLDARLNNLQELHPARRLHIHRFSLPKNGSEMIRTFVKNRLAIFYNDLERTEELESASCLAMTTERPVTFTRAAPFSCFMSGATYIEDRSIADILALGMAAQIKLCHDFGEGQHYAKFCRLLVCGH